MAELAVKDFAKEEWPSAGAPSAYLLVVMYSETISQIINDRRLISSGSPGLNETATLAQVPVFPNIEDACS